MKSKNGLVKDQVVTGLSQQECVAFIKEGVEKEGGKILKEERLADGQVQLTIFFKEEP